jgi:hypothetical protein
MQEEGLFMRSCQALVALIVVATGSGCAPTPPERDFPNLSQALALENDWGINNHDKAQAFQKDRLALTLLRNSIDSMPKDGLTFEQETDLVGSYVAAALVAHDLGLHEEAWRYKQCVTRTVSKGDLYQGSMPALSRSERALFDSIEAR